MNDAVATTNKPSKLYTRTLTFTEVTVKMDKRGMPYANFKADTVVKSGQKAGEKINIFGQVFGAAYEALKGEIVVGNTAKVMGFQDQRKADEENGISAVRSFVVRGVPKAKEEVEQAAA
ncbi:hypothetical protein [Microvirga massiliensis]|uniref:hypothetical protein n=1 Tax=Microvirga massiliensis TaxID=1033741 RepID=UPI00062B79AC|nr:hypothetical protein [Microvirga massiliensis]